MNVEVRMPIRQSRSDEPRERVELRLPLSMAQQLRERAIADRRSINAVIENALRDWLARRAGEGEE